eukprot:TRINITY_DN263_c0_g1_i1.p1 TRINITY_DN263_c0_g1~~TRINITY_DN263_c0_g1_i1.p1  ORF type:complete len:377 (-),score=122.85 TRINITY_DN263_c0_g1_i1:773-1903(-)
MPIFSRNGVLALLAAATTLVLLIWTPISRLNSNPAHSSNLKLHKPLHGVDPSCVVRSCPGPAGKCMLHSGCRSLLSCMRGCKSGDTACTMTCMMTHPEDSTFDALSLCLLKEGCLKPEPTPPFPDSALVDPAFQLPDLAGTWYVVGGYDKGVDCYPCQSMTFTAARHHKYASEHVFQLPHLTKTVRATLRGAPEPGTLESDYVMAGIPGADTWYVLHHDAAAPADPAASAAAEGVSKLADPAASAAAEGVRSSSDGGSDGGSTAGGGDGDGGDGGGSGVSAPIGGGDSGSGDGSGIDGNGSNGDGEGGEFLVVYYKGGNDVARYRGLYVLSRTRGALSAQQRSTVTDAIARSATGIAFEDLCLMQESDAQCARAAA